MLHHSLQTVENLVLVLKLVYQLVNFTLVVQLASINSQPINIYYGAQSEQELYFTEQLDNITKANNNLKFYPVTSEKSKNKTIRQGLVTDAVIEDINDFDGYKAYLAGPPKMVESAEKILTDKGIRKVDIHSDAFYTPYDEIKE